METSVEVPPMSKVMKRSVPNARARLAAPITPAAGPDRIVRTGSARARSAPIALPLDCMTRRRAGLRQVSRFFRCDDIRGATYALTTAVEKRSYSRYSARIRCETDSGRARGLSARAINSSAFGLAYE